jgi:small subunit ribosomal protein S1
MVNQLEKEQDTASIGFTHADFEALLDKYDYHFNPGDTVAGTVFSLEPRGALIDIGAKTAAYIPIQEMSINRVESPDEVLQSNETREFFILTDENEDGQLTLSIRRIEYMRAWERVRQLQQEDATVRSGVFATNRGGALVRIEGLRGFIPGSHISTRKPKEDLVGEDLPLKFLEVDEERNRLVLSHRRALVERKMNGLQVGEVVLGTVRGLKPYGAFIDIGGVSGLLHISEISHRGCLKSTLDCVWRHGLPKTGNGNIRVSAGLRMGFGILQDGFTPFSNSLLKVGEAVIVSQQLPYLL